MAEQLVSLQTVKDWLLIKTNDSDAVLNRLIPEVSRFILSYLSISSFLYRTVTTTVDGKGTSKIMLPDSPVWEVSSLAIDGLPVPAATTNSPTGFVLESAQPVPPSPMQLLGLNAFTFTQGNLNVALTYKAGYAVLGEAQTIAATVTVNQPYGPFARDESVQLSPAGVPLEKVSANPAPGQYSVSATGVYTFNAADTGTALISYSYIPSDIEQACLELVCERFKYRDRIGQKSKALNGQEVMNYNLSAMPEYVKTLLGQYKRVFTPW